MLIEESFKVELDQNNNRFNVSFKYRIISPVISVNNPPKNIPRKLKKKLYGTRSSRRKRLVLINNNFISW